MDFQVHPTLQSKISAKSSNHPKTTSSRISGGYLGQDDDALGRMVVESPNGVGESQIGFGRWIFRCKKKVELFGSGF